MFKRLFILALSLTLFFVSSCEKNEEIYGNVKVSETDITLGGKDDAAKIEISISSDYMWTAIVDSEWLSMSTKAGNADTDYKVTLKASTNEGTEARSANIIVTSGKTHVTIKVTQERGVLILTAADVPDYDKIYIPKEYENQKFFSSEGKWFFGRSAQSEHFIIFWDQGYGEFGDVTPSNCPNTRYRVDIEGLLNWAEQCYDCYVNTMKFADLGKSILDSRKIDIWLEYTTTWAAYGSGLEDNVGCLWINPDAASYKSTLAHEVGHSFQYIVGCDLLYNKVVSSPSSAAFRYDIGQGNGFWEQTAQWQAYVMVPSETFTNYNFDEYCKNAHKHLIHEDNRYTNYFIHHYWTDKYGIDAVANVWKSARYAKDAIQAYQALHELSIEELNDQFYDYAAKVATWDFESLRKTGVNYINKMVFHADKIDDGYYKVGADVCPEATGFNVIRIQNYTKGGEVTMELEGLPNETGYNSSGTASDGGWSIGFVVLANDKTTRYYSAKAVADASTDYKTTVTWTIPSDTYRAWAIVAATPVKYISHKWDENNSNDRQWPYKFKITGATPVNNR